MCRLAPYMYEELLIQCIQNLPSREPSNMALKWQVQNVAVQFTMLDVLQQMQISEMPFLAVTLVLCELHPYDGHDFRIEPSMSGESRRTQCACAHTFSITACCLKQEFPNRLAF